MGFSYLKDMTSNLRPGTIFNVMFFFDTTSETINIRYLKLQQVLANIGGFIKVIMLFMGIFVIRFQEIDFMNTLI